MFSTFLNMYKVSVNIDANTIRTFFKNKISSKVATVFAIILRVLGEFAIKTAFVAVFMFLPHIFFSKYMETGILGFGLENCFVYFGVVLCGLCGSVVRSELFRNNDYSYLMLKIYRVNPLQFFRSKILLKTVLELVAFWFAFSVFGMNIAKAFYLALVIELARFVGEAFNIYIFRITGKSLLDLRGMAVFLMLGALIVAYFVPYIRGFVPAAYNLVFSTTWLPVILVAGSFFMYYIWNYKSYSKIAMRIYTLADLMDMNGEEGFSLKEKYKSVVGRVDLDEYPDEEMQDYIHSEKFFMQNKKIVANGIITRVFSIFAVIIAVIIVAAMGNTAIVYKVISYSLPVLIFIMYIMSRGKSLCRELFYSGDKALMEKGYYNTKENVFRSYITVLKNIILIDLIHAIFLVFAYVLAAFLVGQQAKMETVISVCLGILFLSVFFSTYNVLMYYMCMPFAPEENKIGKSIGAIIYYVCNGLVYVGCYFFIFVDAKALHFLLVIALVCAVFMSIAATLVWNLGLKTFKVKDK